MASYKNIAFGFLLLSLTLFSYAGTVEREVFKSSVLKREYAYTIYLPEGYADADFRYSVLYLLHGSNGSEMSWLNQGKVKSTLDQLIRSGEIAPLIVVMPGHNESWWADGKDEKAQSALLKDLFPRIEKKYRTTNNKRNRAVAGLSAGGFGTINLILQYPEMFAAGAALSPAVYTPVPPKSSSAYRHKVFQTNGELDPEVWGKLNWTSHIDAYKAKDTKVPLYINSGDHDRFDIAYHGANFYQVMREFQPEYVEYRVVDGDHTWDVWESTIGDALKYVSKYLAGPR